MTVAQRYPRGGPPFRSIRPQCSDAPSNSGWFSAISTEIAFKCFSDASVEYASRFAQQSSIGGVLHKRVLKQIDSRAGAHPAGNSKPAEMSRSRARTGVRFPVWRSRLRAAHARTLALSPLRSAPLPCRGRADQAAPGVRHAGSPGRQELRGERQRQSVRLRLRFSASSTALVISSTNNGMPSVRSTMSCRMSIRQRPVASDAVDHVRDFALAKAI